MNRVLEIKSAIDRLSPQERAELEALVWPEWERPYSLEMNSPRLMETPAEAAPERFLPGHTHE